MVMSVPIYRYNPGGGDGWEVPGDIPESESDALKWLFDNTGGEAWADKTNWGVDASADNWYGITVAGGKVTIIDLDANNLIGNVGSFAVDDFTGLLNLFLYSNASVSGDIGSWSLPSTLERLYLYSTALSGDISGWTIPAGLTYLQLQSTSVSGDISSWTIPATLIYLYVNSTSVSGDISGWTIPATLQKFKIQTTSISGTPGLGSAVALNQWLYDGNSLTQANVDAICLAIYNRRAAFTAATPLLNIGGSNSAPSGVYQDGDPPTTGKEYIFELENDPEVEGFNTWSITYTA